LNFFFVGDPGRFHSISAFWILAHGDGPMFHLCDYSAQKFFFSLLHTASGAAMFTLSQQQGK
jgi:hypothetical protein